MTERYLVFADKALADSVQSAEWSKYLQGELESRGLAPGASLDTLRGRPVDPPITVRLADVLSVAGSHILILEEELVEKLGTKDTVELEDLSAEIKAALVPKTAEDPKADAVAAVLLLEANVSKDKR